MARPDGVGIVTPPAARASDSSAARAAEWATAALGVLLILLALLADHDWLDRHQLPHVFMPRREQILIWWMERALASAAALVLIFPGRRWVGRRVWAGKGLDLARDIGMTLAAVVMALVVSEVVLRIGDWKNLERWAEQEEPLRQHDPVIGWVNVPNHVGFEHYDGRTIRYDQDRGGRRVARVDRTVDPGRPSILFTGESIMFGYRLNWDQTAAAQIGVATGLQAVNLSVNGYGTDQEWMLLRRQLPQFTAPRVVVALFAPLLVERSLDGHRPHLDTALRWHAANPGWRVKKLFGKLLLYHSAAGIERGIASTRSSMQAIVAAAQARHAVPLIVVPEFGPEQPIERRLREQVLAGLPYVRVELDPSWSIPHDGHPDARANRFIAQAVVAALARAPLQ
jgi:hypothetical protein